MMKDFAIEHLIETDSTNIYIRRLLENSNLENGYTAYTLFQTSGKGQRGNSWESEKGKNLTFSTLLHSLQLDASSQFIISEIISLAILNVLNKETSSISIKWPNDIYWQDKKIAGILIENDLMNTIIYRSIIGVGLNLNQETFTSKAPNPVSLKQITGKTYDIENILRQILEQINIYLTDLESETKRNLIHNEYKSSLFRKEGFYSFKDNQDILFCAEIVNVENSGRLVLKTEDGQLRKFLFKEITYIL